MATHDTPWAAAPPWSIGAAEVIAVVDGSGLVLAPLPDGTADRGRLLGRAAFVLSELTSTAIVIGLCPGRSELTKIEFKGLEGELRAAQRVRRGQLSRASKAHLFKVNFDQSIAAVEALIADLQRQIDDEREARDELERLRSKPGAAGSRNGDLEIFIRAGLAPAYEMLTAMPFRPGAGDEGEPTSPSARFAIAFFDHCLGRQVRARTVKNAWAAGRTISDAE